MYVTLLVLAVLAVAGPVVAYHSLARTCWKIDLESEDDQATAGSFALTGHEAWAGTWPIFVVNSPFSLAFAGWAVAARRHSQVGEPLHAWTRWFAACAGICNIAWLAMPVAGPGCNGEWGPLLFVALGAVIMGAYGGNLFIPYQLLILKLRLLGRSRLAWYVRTLILSSVVLAFVYIGAVIMQYFLESAGTMPSGVLAIPKMVADGCMSGVFLSFVAASCCGALGLLAGAASAARSGRPGSSPAACWVGVTGALVLTSIAMTLVEGFYFSLWFHSFTHHDFLAWSCALTANNMSNCMSVALLSGLVGPRSLRRLAVESFEQINSYSADELQKFYLEFLAYLDDAQVKWVRCRYLRRLHREGATMVRCQDVPSSETVVGSDGFPAARGDDKRRFVVSHPWLSKQHPDPDGVKVRALVGQLDLLGASDEDAVFFDFMSVPQHDQQDADLQRLDSEDKWPDPGEHPAVRTVAEEAAFKKAIDRMELLYSMSGTPVVVLLAGDHVEQGSEYITRGWCVFEFSLALSFNLLANADADPAVGHLRDSMILSKANTVDGFRRLFDDARFTQKGDKEHVLQLFEQTLNKIPRSPSDE